MNFKKFISLFLAVLMLSGALTGLFTVAASAAEADAETETGDLTDEEYGASGFGVVADKDKDDPVKVINTKYFNSNFECPEQKIASMKKWSTKGNYVLYADEQSGEVALQDLRTGQILFTNPYDIGFNNATENVKNRLMSQIIVTFKAVESDNTTTYTSFEDAASKDQIKIRNIKNGIRVEYTIGREEARHLVPRCIRKDRFEELILAPLEEHFGISYEEAQSARNDRNHPLHENAFYLCKQMAYFIYKDLDEASSDRLKQDMLTAYPILSDMDIYVLESTTSTTELEKLEQTIKTACPNYTYEEMDYDHQITEWPSEEENPPLFKMALEYTIDDVDQDGTMDGFAVRLPANGIRFNESMFELLKLQVLPYLGAGNNAYDGYAFFPDGSGSLFTFADMLEESNETITAKIYGEDYAYHKLEQKYQQTVRYPVYGIVEDTRFYDFTIYNEVKDEEETTTISGVVYDAIQKAIENGTTSTDPVYKKYRNLIENGEMTERTVKRGFAAFVVEGEALTSLSYVHEGTQAPYDTISMICNPRPRDEYNLADAISVGDNKTVSVVTKRKYVGNYKLHLTMLSDETLADEAVAEGKAQEGDLYEASWLGMGIAYRDYLVKKGMLTAPDSTVSTENIPMYIESFGAMETIEKILSVPVEVTRPLTSAEDVNTMYKELSEQGVTNINFKLTGYANGGMYATIPYNLKWEKAVSENMSMQELFNAAAASDGKLGIYPDFDFSYVSATKMFDGFSMRKHVVRTIDDRNSYKREYMATRQKYAGYFQLVVSPAYFDRFYTKLMDKYLAYENVNGISVGTLGTALNSDFDEDEPYNREDAKGFITTALEFISGQKDGNLQVMVDGGNAYTWKYVDHIVGASIDSSRYIVASYSVPFLGVVLHGYKNFTGSPLNMEGDLNYAKLKAIENGASIYFTLSYQNTQNLKEDYQLSKYYSVRYDIWFDDVVEIYNELNNELKDLQNMPIIGHSFLTGMRVPDTDELDRDLEEEFNEVMNFQGNQQAFLDQLKAESVADARAHIAKLGETIKDKIKASTGYYAGGTGAAGAAAQFQKGNSSFLTALSNYRLAEDEYNSIKALYESGKADDKQLTVATEALEKSEKKLNKAVSDMAKNIIKIRNAISEIDELLQIAREGVALIESTPGCPQNIIDEVKALYAEAVEYSQEQMGMDFIYTTANLEIQTFLDIQYMLVIEALSGDVNHSGTDIVGLIEKQYLAIANDEYGLVKDPATYVFLRYLDENRNLSDAELDAKYELVAGKTSVKGLVRYIKDILGEDASFDPILEATGGVDAGIQTYVENRYLLSLSQKEYKSFGKNDKEGVAISLKLLNINPNQHGSAFNVNNVNIIEVLKKVNAEITGSNGPVGLIAKKTEGDFSLDAVYTAEQMKELVDKIDKILNDYEYANAEVKDGKVQTYIEYLTPETRKADVENYIRAFYYAKVVAQIAPTESNDLPVLNAKSNSEDSLAILFNSRVDTYGVDLEGDGYKYAELVEAYIADLPEVRNLLAAINNNLKPYGNVTDKLEESYLILFANYVVKNQKAPGKLDAADDPDGKKGENKDLLNAAAEALVAEKVPAIKSFDDLKALAAEVVALHGNYPASTKEDYDATAMGTAYAYRAYFEHLSKNVLENVTTHRYYYDSVVAEMDAAVMARVEEKTAEIEKLLPADPSLMEYLDAVFTVIADPDDSTYKFTSELASKVSYSPAKKGTIEEDVTEHYLYQLFNSLRSAALGKIGDYPISVVVAKGSTMSLANTQEGARKAIQNHMSSLLTDLMNQAKSSTVAGGTPNYSLTAVLGEEGFNELINTIYTSMSTTLGYEFDKDVSRDQINEEIGDMIKFCFYSDVLKRLNCQKPVDFNLHEVYDSSLEESCENLHDLVKYYALSYTAMTEEDFTKLFDIKVKDDTEEEEDEASRYVSDDGRIVSVTYGQAKANGGYTPYKTFVLNYNNFSVNVVYEGITYTIPAYGYVTVMHPAE